MNYHCALVLCDVKTKQMFSFAPALWSHFPSGLHSLLLQTAFQQHAPLSCRKTLSCNRQILPTLTLHVQEELESTFGFVYVRYIIPLC